MYNQDVVKIHKQTIFLATVTLMFILLAAISKTTPYFPIDLTVTRAVQQISVPGFTELMKALSYLGNLGPILLTLVLVSMVLLALKKPTAALVTELSYTGLSAFGLLVKILVARPRPDSTLINQLGVFVKADSFPSGHVLQFMSLYGFLFIVVLTSYKKSWLRNITLAVLFLLLVGIGLSRIDVGAHWFSDVLGSYLVGFVWLYFMARLYSKLNK
jgi:undecaprenyl-diphosphatase